MDKLNITIPSDWKDITIGTLQELGSVDPAGISGIVNYISCLCDSDPADIEQLTLPQLKQLREQLKWSEYTPTGELHKTFEIDDIQYGLVDFNKLTVGEFADLESILAEPNGNDKLHLLLAIVYRPIIKWNRNKYEIEKYDSISLEERSEIFKNKLSVSVGFGASLFFCNFARILSTDILHSLEEELMMERQMTGQ